MKHGTDYGYQKHLRQGEAACSACKQAHADYQRAYTKARGGTDYFRERDLQALFGMTVAEYDQMDAAQLGQCKICGVHKRHIYRKRLVVDHDHETGQVRGLLCNKCNQGLGLLGDNEEALRKALSYLQGGEA